MGCSVRIDATRIYGESRPVPRGTFGMVVRDLEPLDSDHDNLLVLTAGHVFPFDLPEGVDVPVQWASDPSGPWRPLGTLRRRMPSTKWTPVPVDAAVIKPYPTVTVSSARGNGANPMGVANLWKPPPEGQVAVSKLGATTGLTRGLLDPVDAKHRMVDGTTYNLGWWVLGDRVRFAGPGDSGAIVVDDANRAVGMAVAIEDDEDHPDVQCLVHGITQILRALAVEAL